MNCLPKACPSTYTELFGKDWETYWFQEFEETSAQSLAGHYAKQRLQWLHVTQKQILHNSGKSVNKDQQNSDNSKHKEQLFVEHFGKANA